MNANQRARITNRRIGTQQHQDARIDHLLIRIRPAAARPDRFIDHVDVQNHIVRLDTGRHLEFGQSLDVFGSDHLGVLNAMRQHRRHERLLLCLAAQSSEFFQNGDNLAIGPIPDGMNDYGQPCLFRRCNLLAQLRHGAERHAVFGIQVRLQHPGRACPHTAVREVFEMADAKAFITETGPQSQGDGLLQTLTGKTHPTPQIQLSFFV